MKLVFGVLAEEVMLGPDKKVYMRGGLIEDISGDHYPLQSIPIWFVLIWRLRPRECERAYAVEIRVVSDAGDEIAGIQTTMHADLDPTDPKRPRLASVFWFLPDLVFPRPGNYQFRVFVDGEEKYQWHLYAHFSPGATTLSA